MTYLRVCDQSSESDYGVFVGLSIVFILYLTLDIGLAIVAILRTRPASPLLRNAF